MTDRPTDPTEFPKVPFLDGDLIERANIDRVDLAPGFAALMASRRHEVAPTGFAERTLLRFVQARQERADRKTLLIGGSVVGVILLAQWVAASIGTVLVGTSMMFGWVDVLASMVKITSVLLRYPSLTQWAGFVVAVGFVAYALSVAGLLALWRARHMQPS